MRFLQLVWNGVVTGAVYGMVAIGYTLIFGIIRVVFFAQGELSMVAAFAALAVLTTSGGGQNLGIGRLALAGAAGVAASVACALAAERACLRPLQGAAPVKSLIASLGVSIVLQNVIMLTAGAQPLGFAPVHVSTATVFGIRLNLLEVGLVLTFIVTVITTWLFLSRHRYGIAIRAVAQSRDGARLMGINPDSAIVATFALSGVTAGLAGILMALYNGAIRFNMGFLPGIKGFTIAILGGVGNLGGAAAAALLLGIAEALFAGFVSATYRDLIVFVTLVGLLAWRPRGLFGIGQQ